MRVFLTLKGSQLRVVVEPTNKDGVQLLTNAVQDLGKQLLSGRFTSYVEDESGIISATLIFTAQETDLTPHVKRSAETLLH